MRYCILLLVLGLPFLLNGQQRKFSYAMHGFNQQDKAYLRWAPKDYASWKAGLSFGYRLDRYMLVLNGEPLDQAHIIDSKVTLLDNAQPLPVDDWQDGAATNDNAGVAAATIYGDTIEIEGVSPNPLVNMVDQNNIQDARFTYGLLAADLDFQVATDMGLGYIDYDILLDNHHQYLYVLTLAQGADTSVLETGNYIINEDSLAQLSTIDTISAKSGDRIVSISWRKPPNDDYSAYNIERSSDGGSNYIKVNNHPFVILDAGQPDKINFNDTIENNSTTYVYRVKGINGFGIEGPPSDTIQVKGKESRLKCYALITDVDEAANQVMNLTWILEEVDDYNKLQELNVYRAKKENGPYEKINSTPLSPTQTQFSDTHPAVSSYYKVIITDVNGYEYESIHSLAQLADSIPPAIPTGLVGSCDKYGIVKLKWNSNTESDFNGYRVFVSNFADSLYLQISNDIVRDTTYSYSTDLNTLTRKVYFRITSEDTRHNRSEQSATCEISRPDIIPPSNPLLFDAKPMPSGIEISFVPSQSSDVAIHKLQKRKKGAKIWITIYSINGVQSGGDTYAFVDSLVSYDYIYQYRVLAYDQTGNYSSSKVFDVRGYDSGIRGNILDVSVTKVNYTPSNTTTSNPNNISVYPGTVNIVQWRYPDTTGIYNFQVYRSVDNAPFRIYDVIYLPQDTIREDPQIRSHINTSKFWYVDMQMLSKFGIGNNPNNGGSNGGNNNGGSNGGNNGGGSNGGNQQQGGTNTNGSRTYQYKIMANHRDGGTSKLSSDVNVVVN